MPNKKPTVLIILDGWGYSQNTESNAIFHAKTPVIDNLMANYPNMLIGTSGMAVGLPEGQMGNSEVGHVNLGAGRVVYQDFTRITKSIADDEFKDTPALCQAVDKAVTNNKAVHICGLLSPGGVHSHEDHIIAMIEAAKARGAEKIYLHAFLDGRDTPPRSAEAPLKRANDKFAELGCGQIASVIGRYYAMDRDQRWERVEAAYNVMVDGKAEHQYSSTADALAAAYARDENDEFVAASAITTPSGDTIKIEDGDSVIFMNFRADRARQFTRVFTDENFNGFTKARAPKLADFVMLTEYAADITASCAFPPAELTNVLGEWLEKKAKHNYVFQKLKNMLM